MGHPVLQMYKSSEIKIKTHTQSIYSKNNLYLSKNVLSIWMMHKYFIAFRTIQIHKIIWIINNTYLIFSPFLAKTHFCILVCIVVWWYWNWSRAIIIFIHDKQNTSLYSICCFACSDCSVSTKNMDAYRRTLLMGE